MVDRTELSRLAYGFMASKALFAALGIDLFSRLSDGHRTVAALSASTGVAANRLETLLHALAGIGLVVAHPDGYVNAPAAERHLVRGVPGDLGPYFRLQVSQQVYPALVHLDAGLAGTGAAFDTWAGLLADPREARTFTEAQHAGSLGAARRLADRLALAGPCTVLDVGGGSGAFSIAFCERDPDVRSTVLDLPAVVDVAREYRDAAGLTDRVALLAADAVRDPWPDRQDVVLMSYLLSALGDGEIDVVLAKAHACLRPGGLLVVHDFMLHDDEPGPAPAALWFLQYVACRPDAVSFSGAALATRLRGHGFEPRSADVLIPEITKVVLSSTVVPT
ncbi:class I SAM-dependent methyltransferase [Actinomycetospora cinnamomea]|uniref:class I SAM-dependent methyltransferase n=1 Tax=Actinomycetospora cinnamomea TaxID=663609 RepID=UPI001402ED73|nr:class I SAM-dependent methyltransferase [Actinomycetospora cinnamomea]